MIIKSVVLFLGIVEAVWDAYDWVSTHAKSISIKKTTAPASIKTVKPSYQIQ